MWPYLPGPPVEDGHRGGRPWRPRLSDAVAMMPENDWFHGSGRCSLTARGGGTLPHLGEETLAGCEMLVNKVIARVTVRPCQPPPTPTPPCSSSRNSQPGLVLLMKNIVSEFILCLESDLGFVCLCVKWICRQQCPGLKKKGEEPKQQGHLLVNGVPLPRLLKLQLKLPIAKKSKNKSLIVREFFSPDTSPAKCCKQAPHFQV